MSSYLLVGLLIGIVLMVALGGLFFITSRRKKRREIEKGAAVLESPDAEKGEQAKEELKDDGGRPEIPSAQVVVPKIVEIPEALPDLNKRLAKTRSNIWGKIDNLFRGNREKENVEKELEGLEEVLLEGDIGINTATLIMENIRGRLNNGNGGSLKEMIQQESEKLFDGVKHGFEVDENREKPYVISIVGVNGVGKTTTIGKIARRLSEGKKTVLIGAADTFRAAAISQLKVWAERSGSQFVSGREGGDPGAVAFDSVSAAKARQIDYVLLDTAGRLHTKSNLMDELKKVSKVVKKVIPEAPHETWLVIDGTFGQNSVIQAREFQKALELTGVIVTKLDGTAKGGALLSIASEMKLPIRYIGIGESEKDLIPFDPRGFVQAIFGSC